MKMRLEGTKSLDADVEKDGAKEIRYDKDNHIKDSYDCLFDDLEYEIFRNMEITDDDKAAVYAARTESEGMEKMLTESEMSDELWSASNLGKHTINTPTQEKQKALEQEKYLEPVPDKEFQEIAEGADQIDLELQKEFDAMAKEMEGIF